MKKVEIQLFSFAELSEKAKDVAREWLREGHDIDKDYFKEALSELCCLIGFEMDEKDGPYWSTNPDECAISGTFYFPKTFKLIKEKAWLKEWPTLELNFSCAKENYPGLNLLDMGWTYCKAGGRNGWDQKVSTEFSREYKDSKRQNSLEADIEDIPATLASIYMKWVNAELAMPDDDEWCEDMCQANEWLFTADGKFFRH